MKNIFDLFAIYNFIFVLVLIVIMGIGHLTHADYYSKIKKPVITTFWSCTLPTLGLYGVCYIIISMIAPDQRLANDFILNASAVTYLIYYAIMLVLLSIIGYNKLYNYFGKKRHKL